MSVTKRIIVSAAAIALIFGVTACNLNGQSASQQDQAANSDSYNHLVAAAPAKSMTYPVSRDTINGWVTTWNKPNAISYNYIETVYQGQLVTIGFYELKGLPVSMCTALTPTQRVYKSSNGNVVLNNPGIDGVYYSGGDCERYYGFDAITGQYVEYKLSFDESIRTTDQPLSNVQAPNLGPSGTK